MFRYMIGDTLAGGCVAAADEDAALAKVRAYYNVLAAYGDGNEIYETAEITVWGDGEGFLLDHPDVVEVYP
jgi:hypothetical protein